MRRYKYTSEDGAKMIMAIKKVIGIDESESRARSCWKKSKPWEKEAIIRAFHSIPKPKRSPYGVRDRWLE
jgi:hypothetical protein